MSAQPGSNIQLNSTGSSQIVPQFLPQYEVLTDFSFHI